MRPATTTATWPPSWASSSCRSLSWGTWPGRQDSHYYRHMATIMGLKFMLESELRDLAREAEDSQREDISTELPGLNWDYPSKKGDWFVSKLKQYNYFIEQHSLISWYWIHVRKITHLNVVFNDIQDWVIYFYWLVKRQALNKVTFFTFGGVARSSLHNPWKKTCQA